MCISGRKDWGVVRPLNQKEPHTLPTHQTSNLAGSKAPGQLNTDSLRGMTHFDAGNVFTDSAIEIEKEIEHVARNVSIGRTSLNLGIASFSVSATFAILAITILLAPLPFFSDQSSSGTDFAQIAVDGMTQISHLIRRLAILVAVIGLGFFGFGIVMTTKHESRMARIQLEHARALAFATPPGVPAKLKPRKRILQRRKKRN